MIKNQVVLITGTRRGIGRHLVEHFVKQGFRVIGCSRNPVDYKFKNYQHFCLDVSDETKVKQMFSEIRKAYGSLDILINNAGIISRNYALLTPLKAAEYILKTNFIGTFLFCCGAIKIMQKSKTGRIINISSIAVPLAEAGTSIYSASKAAVEQFSKVLAKEVISYGITVNSLRLSFVRGGGMAEEADGKAARGEISESTISKPWLDIKEITDTIDFLISEEAKIRTGETICLGENKVL